MQDICDYIVWLCCSDIYVGAFGAAILSNALKTNRALKELYIKGNEFGNEGTKVIYDTV